MTSAIEVRDLVRRFEAVTAVDHLSFAVQPGEVFGFLGPNGAGKSTTINFVVLPLYFLSAAQFPLNRAPSWIQVLAALNPLAYAVDLLRGLLDGLWTHGPALDLAVITGFAVVALAAATYMFSRQE